MARPIRIECHDVMIEAPRELVYQLMSSFRGGLLKGAGAATSQVLIQIGPVLLALGGEGVGHSVADDFLARHGVTRTIAVSAPTFMAAAAVAASTDLIAGLPERLADTLSTILPIARLALPLPPFGFQMHLIWHERTERDPICRAFRQLVIDLVDGESQAAMNS